MSASLPTGPGYVEQAPPRSQRVLACVLCQQRKVKCDRRFPCANCVKHEARCVPATQTRRRRRRFPERELLDRLGKYEDLLRQNNVAFEPLHEGAASVTRPSRDSEGVVDSDDERHRDVAAGRSTESTPRTTAESESVYAAKDFWNAMNQRSPESSDGSNSAHDEPGNHVVREAAVRSALDHLYDNKDHLLFASHSAGTDLSTVHPEPVHIFRLWQIYLDNVDPLLKVTHTPSLQERIIEAAADLKRIAPALEALMFSIYCMSVLSLDAEDCQAFFGSSKEDLLTRFQFGCQQALSKSRFLRTSDRDCLTALYLYLVSVRPETDPRALSSTLGVAIRIAKRMGLHNEAAYASCGVLEAEMRRRLWWSLALFDTRIGELAGSKSSTLAPTWDCRVPLNVNDSDLRAELKQPPAVQGKSSEALFAVVRSELADSVRYAAFYLDFTTPALKPLAKSRPRGALPEGEESVGQLERMVEEKYLRFCDPNIPLHFLTIWMTRAYLLKCRLMDHYSTYSGSSVPQTEAQRDAALSYAAGVLECDTKILTSPLTKGYRWLLHFYFPFPAYVHIVQDLRKRPLIQLAERTWEAMSDNFEARALSQPTQDVGLFRIFSTVILQAWDAREAASGRAEEAMTPPRIVLSIRRRIAEMEQNSDTKNQDGSMDMDIGEPSMSMPPGPADLSLLYSMGWQNAPAETSPGTLDSISAQFAMPFDMNQSHWPTGSWGLGGAW